MSLEYAILGFLNYKPFSGYDLKKIFDTSVQHFWPADQSQIYRTLAKLEEKGFAEQEIIAQEDRPNRKVYHITEAGRQGLNQWLAIPLDFPEHRSATLIQVFFAGQLPDEKIIEMFERARDYIKQGLARFEQIPQQVEPYINDVQSPRETFCWMLTLESGITMARANLAWIESVLQRLRNGELPRK